MTRLLFACALLALPSFIVNTNAQEAETKTEAAAPDYVILTANGLKEVATEWAAMRAGHGRVTKVVTLAEISGDAKRAPSLVDIKSQVVQWSVLDDEVRPGFQLLLMGDCPDEGVDAYDPASQIPWFLTRQEDSNPEPTRRKRIPTDNFLADVITDEHAMPDIAVGRIPARTVEDARLALKKVKAYEAAPQGEWLRNLTFFAGEGRFGAQIDRMLENLFTQFAEQTISQAYTVRMTYANIRSSYAYVPRLFSDKVIDEANAGALMLTYMGHGLYDRLDNMDIQDESGKRVRAPILSSDDVAKFNIPDGKLPVMLIVACQTGYMDHPKGCLAEKICFTEKAPVAVIGSSRDSHPYSNTLLQKALVSAVSTDRVPTLGEALLIAKRELVLAEDPDRGRLELMAKFIIPKDEERTALNASHMSMYNLTGDPGLRMRYPTVDLQGHSAEFADGKLTVRIRHADKLPEGTSLSCAIEVRRTEIAGELKSFTAADLVSADADKRKAAEEAVRANHATSNSKLLLEPKLEVIGSAKLDEGGYETVLQGKLEKVPAAGEYNVKVYATVQKSTDCGFTATKLILKK